MQLTTMRLQKEKAKELGSVQGCCHRLFGTAQGRSNPDVLPQDTHSPDNPEQIRRMEDAGTAGSRR